jgi:glycine/serine hydroxymethyltransferase
MLTSLSAVMVGLALLTFSLTNPSNAQLCGAARNNSVLPSGTAVTSAPGGVRIGPTATTTIRPGSASVKLDGDGYAYRSAAAAAVALQEAEAAGQKKRRNVSTKVFVLISGALVRSEI